jgi:hypothetical protein
MNNNNMTPYQRSVLYISSLFATIGFSYGIWKVYRRWINKQLKKKITQDENKENILKDNLDEQDENVEKIEENMSNYKPSQTVTVSNSSITMDASENKDITESAQNYLDFELVKKIFKEYTHITVDTLMRAYRYLEDNQETFASVENKKVFKNEGKLIFPIFNFNFGNF